MASNATDGNAALPVIDINEMRPSGKTATATAIALLTFASLTVGLRILTRTLQHHSFNQSDFWLILGLGFFASYCAVLIRALQACGGTLVTDQFTAWGVQNFYKYLYAMEILLTVTITSIKLSLLLLYITIFLTREFIRYARIVMALCVAWFVTFLLVLVFQCTPIHAFWDMSLVSSKQGTCIPFGSTVVVYEATNVAIDVVILSLPIFMIKSLHLPKTRKIAVTCVFLLGSLVLVVCGFRIYYLTRIINSTVIDSLSETLNWSTAESATAIVCASVPTYGIYFNKAGRAFSKLSARLGFRPSNTQSRSQVRRPSASVDGLSFSSKRIGSKAESEARRELAHASYFAQEKPLNKTGSLDRSVDTVTSLV